MEKMHEKIRNLKRFDRTRNDCARCKPGRVQCPPPMEKVYNQHDSVFVFICNLCLSYLYFKTANVFQHAFSVVHEQEVAGTGCPCWDWVMLNNAYLGLLSLLHVSF